LLFDRKKVFKVIGAQNLGKIEMPKVIEQYISNRNDLLFTKNKVLVFGTLINKKTILEDLCLAQISWISHDVQYGIA